MQIKGLIKGLTKNFKFDYKDKKHNKTHTLKFCPQKTNVLHPLIW